MKNIRTKLLIPTSGQAKDTGLAMILICLLIAHFGKIPQFVPAAMVILLISMICPDIFKPVAWLWFGLSHILGTIASRIVLSVLFFVLVTPIGFIRRIIGIDSMLLNQWKKGSESLFIIRDHRFSAEDIEKPY